MSATLIPLRLSHGAENRVVTTYGRTVLIVIRLRVTYLVKVRLKWKFYYIDFVSQLGVQLLSIEQMSNRQNLAPQEGYHNLGLAGI